MWPVQFMISAVTKPPGVPSTRNSRTDFPDRAMTLLVPWPCSSIVTCEARRLHAVRVTRSLVVGSLTADFCLSLDADVSAHHVTPPVAFQVCPHLHVLRGKRVPDAGERSLVLMLCFENGIVAFSCALMGHAHRP
jgi:hypothetical protein